MRISEVLLEKTELELEERGGEESISKSENKNSANSYCIINYIRIIAERAGLMSKLVNSLIIEQVEQ